MLLRQDLTLDKVIGSLVRAQTAERQYAVTGASAPPRQGSGWKLLLATLADDCDAALRRRAAELARWGETALAGQVEELRDLLGRLRSESSEQNGQLLKALERAIWLQCAIHSVLPLEQSPGAWGDDALVRVEGKSRTCSGCALVVEFTRRSADSLDRGLFRAIRQEIHAARGLRLTPYTPKDFCEARSACEFHDAEGVERRLLVEPRSSRLHDAATGEPLAGHRAGHVRGIGYFFLPDDSASASNLVGHLLKLTWALSILVSDGLSFKLIAAPATLRWREATHGGSTTLRVVERDRLFDLLPELLPEPSLDNSLLVHAGQLATEHKLNKWFSPTGRLPPAHRKSDGGADEWLWTTASFQGIPGAAMAPDITGVTTGTLYFEPGQHRPSTPSTLPERHEPSATTRIAPRRAVACILCSGTQRSAAYLVEYSALGCRVRVSISPAEAEALQTDGELTLVVPDGLYWPWASESSPVLGPDARYVRCARFETATVLADDGTDSAVVELILSYRLAASHVREQQMETCL